MKILHTSDWHLGRSLYSRKRYHEFSAFLDWLLQTISDEQIDILLIAGDVFDTNTPSNKAQALYYQFLCRVAASNCHHVVVIAGNHDSPSFLNAPKELLKTLKVWVVGAVTEKLEDQVLVLEAENKHKAIVCAIPYLRDKDIRTVEAGENIDDKNAKLVQGVKDHYARVCDIAKQKQKDLKEAGDSHVPIIAMGHLFTAGGKTVDGDGVRELYVGSLAHVEKDIFPTAIDYFALGHLHVPQKVGGAAHIRYCGSPLPMGFGEAKQQKKVVVTQFDQTLPVIQEYQVPCFQKLSRIVGSLEVIQRELSALKKMNISVWVEIEYIGHEIIGNLRETIEETITDTAIEILRIKDRRILETVMSSRAESENLDELDIKDVFHRCLEAHNILDEDQEALIDTYHQVIQSLYDEDVNKE
ncbi:MAG: exonuclease SbcCD subunit D C-terminal domain-containing protein [Pseudomonadota bacterium]